MTPTSETIDQINERDLVETIERNNLNLILADKRMNRLIKTAFRDGDLAVARFQRLVHVEGPD